MLPRVDLPEVILEVMAWEPSFARAFTAASGSQGRLADLDVSTAACLTAQALNIGYGPVVEPGVDALRRDRLSYVNQACLSAEAYSAANAPLIEAQSRAPLAGRSPLSTRAPTASTSAQSVPSRGSTW